MLKKEESLSDRLNIGLTASEVTFSLINLLPCCLQNKRNRSIL